ncbi:MAG: cytochrome-c peroxidase [Bryobacteraceae bacterium]
MHPKSFLMKITATAVLTMFAACSTAPKEAQLDKAKLSMFAPLPAVMESGSNPITEEKVALGRMLYYEPRLSKGQNVSCNSCHLLDRYGVDSERTSEGHKGQRGNRNAPTVYNAGGHFVQFWDGRAPDVEAQAKGPVLNPVEMAMPSEKHVLMVIKSIPEYVAAFKKAFPEDKDAVTYDNMAKAIGAFERKLVTPSRWDKFLKGDESALTDAEKSGLSKFVEAGCSTCHTGAYVGAGTYQKLGVAKALPEVKDMGRFAVTKDEGDKLMFKVPSLRNIEKTGPYYHDGSVPALDAAVKSMAEYQLGKTLKEEEVASIVTWLKALTGELPADYIKAPELPKSGAKTPKPDLS